MTSRILVSSDKLFSAIIFLLSSTVLQNSIGSKSTLQQVVETLRGANGFKTTEDLNNFCLKSSEGSLQSVIFGNMPRTTSFFHYNSDVMTTFFNGR